MSCAKLPIIIVITPRPPSSLLLVDRLTGIIPQLVKRETTKSYRVQEPCHRVAAAVLCVQLARRVRQVASRPVRVGVCVRVITV